MEYDPIKKRLGVFFNASPLFRKVFYKLLDLLLLRAWHVHRELRKWMRTHPGSANIMDAGSGFGQYEFYLAGKNKQYNILAVDVKEEQVADCNGFFKKIGYDNVRFEVGDLTTYQKPEYFDFILSVDVMEHILEDVDVFRNFYASLKKGGMVLINTPSDQGGSDVKSDSEESFIGEHVRDGYNMGELQAKLNSVGFKRTEGMYTYGTPGKISWKLSMKYPMLMLNVSMLFIVLLPFWYIIFYPICFVLNYFDTYNTHKTGTGVIVLAWKD